MIQKAYAQIMRAATIHKWARRTYVTFLASLFLFSSFLNGFAFFLSSGTTYAQSAEEQCAPLLGTDAYNECLAQVSNQGPAGAPSTPHPYDAAKIHQAYWAFWHCGMNNGWRGEGDGLTLSEMQELDIFHEDNKFYRPTYLRTNGNVRGRCDNAANIQQMFRDMGIADPISEYLTTSGDQGMLYIYNPGENRYTRNDRYSDEARLAILTSVLTRKYPGMSITSETAITAQQYFVIKAHFLSNECITNVAPGTGGSRELRLVNSDGSEEVVNALVRDNNVDVGYGLDGNNASSRWEGTELNCQRMAEILSSTGATTASVIAAWRVQNPDATIPSDNAAAEAEEDNSCESAGGALGWIMCPIAGLLDSVVGFLDENIRDLLYVNQDYFDTEKDSGEDLKGAWTQFRNIAYVILIPIMLVMVIGTALGFEVFSAYTIKKALPRMIIAIIFITLSWYICVFLVNFFNVIGGGLTNLVTAPFSEIHSVAGEAGRSPLKGALDAAGITQAGNGWVQSIASGTTVTTLGVAGVVGAFATGALSLGIIMSTLATAALILGGIFLLLIVRQMLVIALALLAPLAILAWIFPGNDKLWKLWWGSFSKLLMLYPLITLLIGVGQVFAYVTGVARVGDNQLITVIIIIASFIMPFFFIPFAFKWAGGVFGNLAGMVNDRERGLLDRLKKGRAESRSKGWQSFKAGTGENFGQRNRLARAVGTRVGVGSKGRFGFGERGAQALDQSARQASVENVMKNPAWNGINQNDDALHAATYDSAQAAQAALAAKWGGDEEAEARAKKAVAAVQASVGFGRPQAIAAAQQLVSTGTGYADIKEMSQTLARASGGNLSTAAALAGFANSETKRVGRGDLAPGFSNLRGLVESEVGGIYGAGQPTPSRAAYDESVIAASRGQDAVTLLRGKPAEMENLTNALSGHLMTQYQRAQDDSVSQAERDAAADEVVRTMGQIEDLDINKGYASDNNQQLVNDLLRNTASIRQEMGGPSMQRRGQMANDPRMQPPQQNNGGPNQPAP